MTKPKFNIGDKVWSVENGKAVENTITGIFSLDDKTYLCFKYNDNEMLSHDFELILDAILPDYDDWHEERLFFPTKEALIESFTN